MTILVIRWAASHNSCSSRPVHSRMLSMYTFCGLPRFLPPLTIVAFLWQVCCVWLCDRTNQWSFSAFYCGQKRFLLSCGFGEGSHCGPAASIGEGLHYLLGLCGLCTCIHVNSCVDARSRCTCIHVYSRVRCARVEQVKLVRFKF